MNTVEWKVVPGYEGFYEASNRGMVRSVDHYAINGRFFAGRTLRPCLTKRGYHKITLCAGGIKKRFNVNTIVCLAHGGVRKQGYEAAHLNGIKTDNRASNLKWKSRVENEADKVRHGTLATGLRNGKYTKPGSTPRGERHGGAKLTENQVLAIRSMAYSKSQRNLAKIFKISRTNIRDILMQRIWTHL